MKWPSWIFISFLLFQSYCFSEEPSLEKPKKKIFLTPPFASFFLKKNFFLFFPKNLRIKAKKLPRNFSLERINEVQDRLENTGSGMIFKWALGKGFRLFTLTSAKYEKKIASLRAVDQENPKSETNGKVHFGFGWSFFKKKPFKIESYASFNFKYLIENQILMQRFYSLTEDPFGQINFDGISLSINLNF